MNELVPVPPERDCEDIVDHVAMPLFDLRDTSLQSLDQFRTTAGDLQSQIVLAYGGCETEDRVFSKSVTTSNELGLNKFCQAVLPLPFVVSALFALEIFMGLLSFQTIAQLPYAVLTASIICFLLLFCATTGTILSSVLFARRKIRARGSFVAALDQIIEPDHIALSPQGLNLQWTGAVLSHMGLVLPWKRIALAYLEEHRDDNTGDQYEILCIRDNLGKALRLDCRVFASGVVLSALQKRAPWAVKAPPMVLAVQPRQLAGISYLLNWGVAIARNLTSKSQNFKTRIEPGITLKKGMYEVIEVLPAKRFGTDYLARISSSDHQGFESIALRAINTNKRIEKSNVVKIRQLVLPQSKNYSMADWYWLLVHFENQVRRMSNINNNNVSRWLDVFLDQNSLFVVTEHDASKTLRQIVTESGPMPERRVRELALEMCEILSHLHHLDPPYIHNAFTPDSLVLSDNSFLKLSEFAIGSDFLPSKLNAVTYDRRYMSTELLRGFPTAQSDIYSLGGTLYYLLTGSDPTPFEYSITSEKNSSVSQKFNDIIRKATEPLSQNRYASASEVRDAILDMASSESSLLIL